MRHFPIFLDLNDHRVTVSGSGETAAAKLRLLLKTNAAIFVFGENPSPSVKEWAIDGKIVLTERPIQAGDLNRSRLLYCANDCFLKDKIAAAIGTAENALVCIVDNLHESDFITPAMVDRDPVTVAIGTEGTAPILARKIKADLESRLPSTLGMLATEARKFRATASTLPSGRIRRHFWSRYFEKEGVSVAANGRAAVSNRLKRLFYEFRNMKPAEGRVIMGGFGDGDPVNLTLYVRQLLHEADVIVHDPDISSLILELARREAEFIPRSKSVNECTKVLLDRASQGLIVGILLSDVSPNALFIKQIIPRLDEEGIIWEIRPGITAGHKVQYSDLKDDYSNDLHVKAV